MAKQNLYQWRGSTLDAMVQTRDRIEGDIEGLRIQLSELNSVIQALHAVELSKPDNLASTVAPGKAKVKPKRVISAAGKRAIAKAARAMWKRRKAAQKAVKHGS